MEQLQKDFELYLITDSRFDEKHYVNLAGLKRYVISASPLGAGVWQKIKNARKILQAMSESKKIIKELQPDLVMGFGSYVAFPPLYSARQLAIPFAVHEQNSVLGQVHRMMQSKAEFVALSFPNTMFVDKKYDAKIVTTGNPIRNNISPRNAYDINGHMKIVVTGGSQGAKILSDVVPYSLSKLYLDLRSKISVAHQCRSKEEIDLVDNLYRTSGISAEVKTFFTDLPEKISEAHLVISRSGAGTIAEILGARCPSVLIPYPYAKDNHQYYNAKYVVDAGAGIIIDQKELDSNHLYEQLSSLFTDKKRLVDMHKATIEISKLNINATNELIAKINDLLSNNTMMEY